MFTIISVCKGGGYMYCRTVPVHPKANSKKLYPLHRVLVENKIGRILDKDEVVHHIDENKGNNAIENLMVLSASEHARLHGSENQNIALVCPKCGRSFDVLPSQYRARLSRNKSGKTFCSRSCGSAK